MFPETERKVHLHHDNGGATFGTSKRPYANTLCRMNSTSPDMKITTDPDLVTCKTCRRDARFKAYTTGRTSVLELTPELMTPSKPALRTRYRVGWRGKLILQVDDLVPYGYDPATDEVQTLTRWRDATLEDLGLGVV